MKFVFLFLIFFLYSCSSDVKMEQDILAYHIYAQTHFDLNSKNQDNVSVLAKSFGMKKSEITAIQKYILSLKNESALRWNFKSSIEKKITELENSRDDDAREDFVVNVMAPYLSLLARNELVSLGMDSFDLQNAICKLYGQFFPERFKNTLDLFVGDARFYFEGGSSSVKCLHELNANLVQYGYYLDFEISQSSNIMKVQNKILSEISYGKTSVSVLNLKRFIPGLLQSKSGYYTIGSNAVIVVDDMVSVGVEELLAEKEKGDFDKYTDYRFNQFWQSIGVDLNVEKASKIYTELLNRDLRDKNFEYLKSAYQLGVVIHEAKHLVDNIEHPELTLNIDREFSAHVTQTIYSPMRYVTLFSAIERMQNYAMFNQVNTLNEVVRKLWNMAIRSYEDSSYTIELLQSDLFELYGSYRTIREYASFEPLEQFEKVVVVGVNDFYKK